MLYECGRNNTDAFIFAKKKTSEKIWKIKKKLNVNAKFQPTKPSLINKYFGVITTTVKFHLNTLV